MTLAPERASKPLVAFAVAIFVLGTGAFFNILTPLPPGESRGSVLLLWAVGYVVAGLLLLDGALRRQHRLRLPAVLVVVIGLTALSVLWSEAAALTLRRSIGLTGTALISLVLAQRMSPLELLAALRRAMLIVAVASLLLFALGDPRAIDMEHDTLRGVVATKNSLGAFMALGVLAASLSALLDRSQIRRCLTSALPMTAALALTDSTGAALTAAAVVLGTVVAALRPQPKGRIIVGLGVTMFLGLASIVLPQATTEQVAGAIGEDTTLTGRDAIWELALQAGSARPLLGYGYGAFWGATAAADDIRERLQWRVPDAHNGFLDVWLELGLVGLICVLLLLGSILVSGVRDAKRGQYASAAFRLSVGALLIIRNVVESGLLQQNTLLTVLMVVALALPTRSVPAHDRSPDRRSGLRALR